jgi:hypothetical protein
MPPTILDYAFGLMGFVNALVIPLIFALSFAFFIWGIYVNFFASQGKPDKIKAGKSFILWGIFAFFILFSLWGIVNFFVDSLALDRPLNTPTPQFGETGQ